LALIGQPLWLGIWAIILVFTEWLDGFLARGLNGESVTGARLDTIADALFYSSLLAAVFVLNPTLIRDEAIWIAAAAGSYLCSWLASWIKFRRLPSYHTWAAKGAWLVVGAGILCLLVGWSVWPFRVAMNCVVLTNLEAIVITLILSKCRVNVPSAWHVLRTRKRSQR
jgi:CDP-diacylglycerol--glycerol-3-phosphate 3-phosphatidyltransferase